MRGSMIDVFTSTLTSLPSDGLHPTCIPQTITLQMIYGHLNQHTTSKSNKHMMGPPNPSKA